MADYWQNWRRNWSDGYQFGDIFTSLFGFKNNNTALQNYNPFVDLWHGITGQANTDATNSATAALQEDAQAFNAEEAQKQRDFESAEAQINRDWQEEMASTEKQRLVADYKAAGLNPWLAAGGAGGSVSAVGTASGDSASSGMGQGINATKSGAEMLAMAGITAASIIKIIKMLK